MNGKNYEQKIVKLIAVSVLMVVVLVTTAFAISGIGNRQENIGSSSGFSYGADIRDYIEEESDLSSILEIESSSAILSEQAEVYENTSEIPTSSKYDRSCKEKTNTTDIRWGFMWMDIERMKSEVSIFEFRRCSDSASGTGSSLVGHINSKKFFEIIEILKKYEWSEHREFINPYQIGANQITVIGYDTVYTYLDFARDEAGRGFVWSFYDYKIAYLSDADYETIDTIFKNVE